LQSQAKQIGKSFLTYWYKAKIILPHTSQSVPEQILLVLIKLNNNVINESIKLDKLGIVSGGPV